ncbi:hypothetical protein [Mycobacterium sp. 4858]|uniref:hypothetical protein n=1 Tax=Mycobacterium sp. 4858 TaxID=2057185 RepID=UPI001157012C|nr:hypothetical protein [Mycobacterium sp. 4858]
MISYAADQVAQQLSIVSQLLIALAGGLVGGVATVVGQFLISRTNRNISRATQASALRVDRHKAINDFIEVVQRARTLTSKIPILGLVEDATAITEEAHALLAEMWFRRGCLEVICRPVLYDAAAEYAKVVEEDIVERVVSGLTSDDEIRVKFKSTAVLGADGKPELKIEIERDPKRIAYEAAERKFFRAARRELYSPEISD